MILQAHLEATLDEAQTKAFNKVCKDQTLCKMTNKMTTYILTIKKHWL